MPDIAPLSKARKGVMLGAMIALLALSLGMAQLVMRHIGGSTPAKETAVFTLDKQLGLTPVPGKGDHVLTGAKGHRTAVIFQELAPANMDENALAEEAMQLFAGEVERVPTSWETQITWLGHPGIELRDVRKLKGDFAMMRLFLVGEELIGALYIGDTPFTAEDQRVFDALMKDFSIKKE